MPSWFHDEVRPPTTGPASSSSTSRPRELSSKPQLRPARPAPTMMTSARSIPPQCKSSQGREVNESFVDRERYPSPLRATPLRPARRLGQRVLRPEQIDLVGRELAVGRKELQILQLGLCDEKPVEGVCMMKREAAGLQRVTVLDRQRRRAARHHPAEDVLLRRQGKREFPERILDRDLPGARGREEELVLGILEQRPDRLGKLLRPGLHPQPTVRVEEDSQEWNRASTSSGKGASKSSGTSKSPSSWPMRRCGLESTGTSFATGLPARAITISSPPATRRSSRDRCVFASWTLTSAMAT